MKDTLHRLKEIFAELYAIDEDQIEPSMKLVEDLGIDSLDRVDLSCAIDDEFAVTIPDETEQSWLTIQDIITTIEDLKYND